MEIKPVLFIDDDKSFNYAFSLSYREKAGTDSLNEKQRSILLKCKRKPDIASSYEEAISLLQQNKYEMICFDYFLGENKKTGLDVANWILENLNYPFEFYSQSAFEQGRKQIEQVINLFHQKANKND